MKTSLFLTLFVFSFIFGFTQIQTKNLTYSGASFSQSNAKENKMGLKSFSFSSGLENRFKLDNKLNFALQYGASFNQFSVGNFNNNQLGLETKGKLNYKYNTNTSLFSGLGVVKPMFDINNNKTAKEISFTSIKKWQPNVILGIEKQMQLNKNKVYYNIYYQMGISNFGEEIKLKEVKTTNKNQLFQGIGLGLSYQ